MNTVWSKMVELYFSRKYISITYGSTNLPFKWGHWMFQLKFNHLNHFGIKHSAHNEYVVSVSDESWVVQDATLRAKNTHQNHGLGLRTFWHD